MNISQRLRTCARHTGLDAVIELPNEAADEIDALQARAQVQGDPSWWMRETDEGAEWTDTAPLVLSGWTTLYTTPQPAQVQGEPVMDVRCEGCGYMTHHREHMGCVRAAKQHTHPAPSVPADVVRDAIASVREHYRGTDWGKAAECVCDAIDAAMLAAAQAQKGGA